MPRSEKERRLAWKLETERMIYKLIISHSAKDAAHVITEAIAASHAGIAKSVRMARLEKKWGAK